MDVLFVGNDQVLKVIGLSDAIDETFVSAAQVSVVLKNKDGSLVQGQLWPLALDAVSGSPGDYQGILEADLVLKPYEPYTIEVSADDGTNRDAFWKFVRYARDREP